MNQLPHEIETADCSSNIHSEWSTEAAEVSHPTATTCCEPRVDRRFVIPSHHHDKWMALPDQSTTQNSEVDEMFAKLMLFQNVSLLWRTKLLSPDQQQAAFRNADTPPSVCIQSQNTH